ncbi:hypothetical protein LCGC14_2608610 [marine sediment metagenome]|uniref:Uncharacterized protein n=1 Tax=marine sediment metagenome TaxID=412755 RepID=A0A0F9A6K5_9ZZZZ
MKIPLEIVFDVDSKEGEEVRLYFEDGEYLCVNSKTMLLLRDILAQAVRQRKDVLESIAKNLQGK